jgi:hypothetical protein
MIKQVQETYEIPPVPAKTATRTKFECEQCGESFLDAGAANAHVKNTHAYTDRKTLAGYLGDQEDIPFDLRGDEAFHIVTEEGHTAVQGYKGRRGFSSGGWRGPGWYVLQHGRDTRDDRKWQTLIHLQELESNLTQHFQNVVERIRSARKLLGPKCTECGWYNDEHDSYCERKP